MVSEKKLSKAAQKRQDQERAIEKLRTMLPPGSTVYTSLVHVSRSGMYRKLKVLCGECEDITGLVSDALGMKWTDDGCIGVSGCGMDMGFHVVYNLSSAIWHDNFTCTGKGCTSNDHSNGDRDYTPHKHSDGGYALKHRWL
jgi:hypothetical protein